MLDAPQPIGPDIPPHKPAPWRDMKPDAQGFDEVRVITVPRYKTSGLSGDEWRISARIQFWRKGQIAHEIGWGRNVETALQGIGYHWLVAHDDGKALFCGERNICDQEGCCAPATVAYRKLADYDQSGNRSDLGDRVKFRLFCDEHKERGDCGLDDAAANYVAMEMPPAEEAPVHAPGGAPDKGHANLIEDIKKLLAMAERFEFHDFKNTNFATPKLALDGYLNDLASGVRSGRYDN